MITAKQLSEAYISGANNIENNRQKVDALNVFPVPDGDTGTNMSMTMGAAREDLLHNDYPTVGDVAGKAASALLRGARGNSGVITSLLFRGFSKGLKHKSEAGAADLVEALEIGVAAAYKAVMKPTEGTILTVARVAAEKSRTALTDTMEPLEIWDLIIQYAEEALAQTPEQLPVLKKAGVVDAGGQGLCIILRAMQDVFGGGAIVEGDTPAEAPAAGKGVSAAGSFEADITFTYCTEFIVARDKGNDRDPLRLRAYLESIGDCVVVVDDEEIIKVHVHTNDPGKALSEGVKYGQFETVKVENMRIQHANAGWVDTEGADEPKLLERVEPEEEYGFVAVAAGEGLRTLFQDLGCSQVVSGGQTMNPSTDDILNAIQATPAKVVYVLPNNKNIILAAEQAVPLADRKVHVLQTRTIPQGVAALLSFDADAGVEENLTVMMKAADNVSTGSVTFAARDSDFDNHSIKEGEILALENGKLMFTDTDIHHAAVKLAKSMINSRRISGREVAFITLMYGEGMTEEDAEAVRDAITAKAGDNVDITLVDGGQPVYYYFISIE